MRYEAGNSQTHFLLLQICPLGQHIPTSHVSPKSSFQLPQPDLQSLGQLHRFSSFSHVPSPHVSFHPTTHVPMSRLLVSMHEPSTKCIFDLIPAFGLQQAVGQYCANLQTLCPSSAQLGGVTCALQRFPVFFHAIVPRALNAIIPIPNATDVSRGNCIRSSFTCNLPRNADFRSRGFLLGIGNIG